MRAPLIPGRHPEDDDQRDAMLRRLGIAEEKPVTRSRWDALTRELDPTPPVQTPPPVEPDAVEALLPERQPILMTEAPRVAEAPAPEPEPVAAIEPIRAEPAAPPPPAPAPAPQAAPEPEPMHATASFMPGWGEESIPEDEEADAFDEPEALLETEAAPEVLDEPVAEEPEAEPEPEVAAAPTAEVIFIDQAIASAPAAAVEEEPESAAEQDVSPQPETSPCIEALEQVRADLEVISQYMERAADAEVAAATPMVIELLGLAATLLDRSRRA